MSVPRKGVREVSREASSAIAELKKYLPDPVRRIELYDFMMDEVDHAIRSVRDLPVDTRTSFEAYAEQMAAYENASDRLLALLVSGVFHSNTREHDRLWVRCVERLASRQMRTEGGSLLVDLQRYPTLLALYAIGLGAVVSDRADSLARVLGSVTVRDPYQPYRVGVANSARGALNTQAVKHAFSHLQDRKTPISDHLLELLRPLVANFVPSDDEYQELFDEFEYLMGLVHTDGEGRGLGPLGRAVWRWAARDDKPGSFVDRHTAPLIKAGVFKGAESLANARHAYDGTLRASPLRY